MSCLECPGPNLLGLCAWSDIQQRNHDQEGEAMNRRHFLWSASAVSACFAFSKRESLFAEDTPSSGWRTFEVTTRVEVLKPSGTTRIWVPAALITQTPFQKTLSNVLNAEGGSAKTLESRADALGIIS